MMALLSRFWGNLPNSLPKCHYLIQFDSASFDLTMVAVRELAFGMVAVIPISFLVALVTKRFSLVAERRIGRILASVILFFLAGDLLLDAFVPTLACLFSGTGRDKQNQALCLVLAIRVFGVYVGTYLGQSFIPIVLTGSIATGKSTAVKMLLEQGSSLNFTIIDTDKIGHEILCPPNAIEEDSQNYSISPNDSVFSEILEAFGDASVDCKNILTDDGRIDRTKLGAIIFRDPDQRRKLNRITHPRIILSMIKQIIQNLYLGPSKIVCADVPLLFESGKLRWLFAIKIVVACTPELQLERLRKRNPELSEQQCRERIASQIPVVEKAKLADSVIWNNGSVGDLQRQIVDIVGEMEQRLCWATISLSRYVLFAGSLALGSAIYIGLLSDERS